jgi:3',5'-cyclic AMP phosphodiesterase CpdA
MEQPVVIHHLSDIHIGPSHSADATEPVVQAVQPQEPRNLVLYRTHLRDARIEDLPDLVVISGDLTCFAHENEMRTAQDEIQRMVEILREKRVSWRNDKAPCVLMVPGNHDVYWQEKNYDKKIERYARLSNDLFNSDGVLSALYYNAPDRPVCWDFGEDSNLFIYLLSTIRLGGVSDPRLEKIHEELAERHSELTGGNPDRIKFALGELEKLIRQDPDL